MIIEVIVAALLVGMLAIGIFSALDAASARSGAIKSRAIAANVAQADLERMRAMELSEVSNLRVTYPKIVDGIQFTVKSRADWVTDSSGSASCSSSSSAKADYLKISSTVTWPAMAGIKPVVLTSVIAPPSGSFATNQGSLAVQVLDPAGQPVAGKTVTLSGPASFSETTNELGCVLWGFLVESPPSYTVTLGGGCVDKLGTEPVSKTVSVVGEATTTLQMDCGVPGTITATGNTQPRDTGGTLQAVKAAPLRWLTVANSGIGGTGTKVYGNGTPVTSLTTSALYPFTDPYVAYGGNCANERDDSPVVPNTGTPVSQVVPAGGNANVVVRQPALNIDVDDGTNQLSNVTVTATVKTASCSGLFTFTTNTGGQLTDPGVPYGMYDLCAYRNVSGTNRKVTITNVANTAPTGTTVRRFQLNASTPTTGTCP